MVHISHRCKLRPCIARQIVADKLIRCSLPKPISREVAARDVGRDTVGCGSIELPGIGATSAQLSQIGACPATPRLQVELSET